MTTTTTTPVRRRKPPPRWDHRHSYAPTGRDAKLFPHSGVIGEIKPHNTRGINDGIDQLRRRHRATRSADTSFRLLTYRQSPDDVTRFEVLVADPRQLGEIVRSRSGKGRPRTWYRIGFETVAAATRPVPLWQCPTLLGDTMEGVVRAAYQTWMRTTQGHTTIDLGDKSASATGADFTHELAQFLHELATELELEAGYPAW